MAARITIAELAQRAGVSISTVDRMLNGRDPVRKATAERVLAAAEASGFYATHLLKERLGIGRPVVRMGVLLQQSNRTFYQMIAQALATAAQDQDGLDLVVEHMDDLAPSAIAARMLDLGQRVDVLAIVSAEHPRITQAIETLHSMGVPVFGLISGLTAACGTGQVTLDSWKLGRTAAWAISRMSQARGPVAILLGNHRYRCQEVSESGFRSYLREHAPDLRLLEPISTFEDRSIGREVTEALLQREPDLAAIYICGGGISGAVEALATSGRARSIVTVGHELMDVTRAGLMDRVLSMVLSHPVERLATEAIAAMRIAAGGGVLGQRLVPFEISTPENL